jgi:2'-5' RNA ligase
MPVPRLFTGIEIPPGLALDLSLVRGGLAGARWIDPENYHITLRFIGDIDDALAHEIASALEAVRRPALEIRLDGFDVFGGSRPRALIAKVVSSPELIELQAENERLLRRAGAPPETRKFVPHVTLARLRDTSARAAADWLALRGGGLHGGFAAERFVLFSARASTGGGPYIVEADYPLDG